jgi:hypothetical protein
MLSVKLSTKVHELTHVNSHQQGRRIVYAFNRTPANMPYASDRKSHNSEMALDCPGCLRNRPNTQSRRVRNLIYTTSLPHQKYRHRVIREIDQRKAER